MPDKPISNQMNPAETPVSAPKQQAALRFILVVVFLDMLGIGLIIPVLVPLIGYLTDNPSQQAFWFSIVIFSFGLSTFLSAPILGALSDAYGRRRLLLLGFFGFACSFFVTAMASSIWMLLLVRMVAGALEANIAIASAYIADVTTPDKRAQNYGMMGAAVGLGFVIGPAIGGILGEYSIVLPFYFAGCLSLINIVYGYFVLPESLAPENRRPFTFKNINPFSSIIGFFRIKKFRLLLIALFFVFMTQGIISSSWILFTEFKFQWGPSNNGISLFCMGMVMIFTQGFSFKYLLKFFGYRRLCILAAINAAIVFTLWGLAPEGWMLYAITFLNLFSYAMGPALQGLISVSSSASQQGAAMGVTSSMNSLCTILGPLIGPISLAYLAKMNYPQDGWLMGTPLFICAFLIAMTIPFLLLYFKYNIPPTTNHIQPS